MKTTEEKLQYLTSKMFLKGNTWMINPIEFGKIEYFKSYNLSLILKYFRFDDNKNVNISEAFQKLSARFLYDNEMKEIHSKLGELIEYGDKHKNVKSENTNTSLTDKIINTYLDTK